MGRNAVVVEIEMFVSAYLIRVCLPLLPPRREWPENTPLSHTQHLVWSSVDLRCTHLNVKSDYKDTTPRLDLGGSPKPTAAVFVRDVQHPRRQSRI